MDAEHEEPEAASRARQPVMRLLSAPLAATAFLTRIPVPRRADFSLDDVARSQPWFPAVGLLIGAFLLAVDRVANRALPDPSVDVIVVVTLIVITGALHLDGLADAADGLFGAHTPERRLAIMHDVHAGTYAIVAIVSVARPQVGWPHRHSVVRPCRGLAARAVRRSFRHGVRHRRVSHTRVAPAWAMVSGNAHGRWASRSAVRLLVAAAIVLLGAGGILVVLIGGACAIAFGLLCQRLVGGLTGDLYGATVEITEASTFLFIAALANRGWIEAWVLS